MQKFSLTMAVLFVFILSITAQSSGPLDYRLYTTKAHPYMIPNLPSGSNFYLLIKTGHPIYVAITNMDSESGDYFKGTAPSKTILGDTVLINAGDVGNWLVQYSSNTIRKSLLLNSNYQTDLQDQTIGSATYGDYPDFIWVPQGESAKVSAGKYMGNYKWTNLTTNTTISQGYTDSLKTVLQGLYQGWTIDGSGLTTGNTKDTIAVLGKPTFNNSAKTLIFPTTLTGITYKLLKVSSISGTDTTWAEAHKFTGDGNLKTITLTDGRYKLTVTRGIYTSTYPYGYFVVGTTTAVAAVQPSALAYTQLGNRLVFNAPVQLQYYNLQGSQLVQAQGLEFAVPACGAVLFVATDAAGNVVKGKVVSEISK
jgi:hypothetical protein